MFSTQLAQKIITILAKPQQERQYEQNHFLSLQLKKRMSQISNITDWMMLSKCIQLLEIKTHQNVNKQQINWIFVLKGKFNYHGMPYKQGEQIQVIVTDSHYFQFIQDSLYLVLTHQAKQSARLQSEERRIIQQKQYVKKIVFQNITINNKDYNYFWSLIKTFKVKRQTEFVIKNSDDMIFIVISGNLNMNYKWKRLIKLRELGEGSLFSTFLGRYIYKTSEEYKKMEKYQFQYIAKTDVIVLGFCPDLFYQDQRLINYKLIIEKVWDSYQQKVESLKRIINGIGLMKPEKKQVKKYIQEQIQLKFLKQRCVSVPVAIQRRKFRNIAYSIFSQRSNRRKIKNIANTQSTKTMTNSFFTPQKQNPQKDIKTEDIKNEMQKTIKFNTKNMKLDLNNLLKRSQTQRVRHIKSQSESRISDEKRRNTTRLKTQGISLRETCTNFYFEQKHKTQSTQIQPHFYRFFQPQQFVSKKLQNQYEEIVQQLKKIKDQSKDQQIRLKYRNKKQYFQQYINERRIVKLGPKKRFPMKNTLIM